MTPEEVFAGATSGVVASKSEQTPQEKKMQRLKHRKQKMKTRALLDNTVDKFAKMNNPRTTSTGGKGRKAREKQEKEAALKSVVKSGKGVTVVGKKTLKK